MKRMKMLLITLGLVAVVSGIAGFESHPQPKTEEQMLQLCFPHQHYDGAAAPECPAFRQFIIDQLNKE